jgi:hypothetical protein
VNYLRGEGHMSEPRAPSRSGDRRRVGAAWPAALLLPGLAACGSGRVTQPSADLTGVWDLSYSARAAQACGPPAPPGLIPGCSGAGVATITQAGEVVGGTIFLRAGCQSCGSAADSFGNTIPLTGQLRGDRLTLDTVWCHHTARVARDAFEVSGGVTCAYEGQMDGTWHMTRKP